VGDSIFQGADLKGDQDLDAIGKVVGLWVADIQLLRNKRVGRSIAEFPERRGEKTNGSLYEAPVILQKC